MTSLSSVNKKSRSFSGAAVSYIYLALTVVFSIVSAKDVGELVKDGLKLAVECVIPVSFPFMIFTDFYLKEGHPERIPLLGLAYEKLFRLERNSLSAFICGNIGGFPLGAKMTGALYNEGKIKKESAEVLLALSSNPSAPFIIGAVGLGIYKDIKIGILLLLSTYAATLLCGIIFRPKNTVFEYSTINSRQSFVLSDSISNAASASLSVGAFISFFSVISGLIKKYLSHPVLYYPSILLLEVTNAVKFTSTLFAQIPYISIFLTAFSLGFGGISVYIQSSYFKYSRELKMNKYILFKVTEGLINALLSSFLYHILF